MIPPDSGNIFAALMALVLALCGGFGALSTVMNQEDQEPTLRPTATPETIGDFPLALWLESSQATCQTTDEDCLTQAVEVITARLETAGIDSAVAVEGQQIHIQLWGIAEDVIPLVSQMGLLEFVSFSAFGEVEAGDCILTAERLAHLGAEAPCEPTETYPSLATPINSDTVYRGFVMNEAITAANAVFDEQIGQWMIYFTLSAESTPTFGDYTASQIGLPLAIVLDGRVISTLVIQTRIEEEGVLQGNFTQSEAEQLAVILTLKPLPFPMSLVGIKSYYTE